jgi:hypothetical protein
MATDEESGPRYRGTRDTVVFDLGGVLIDWDPRHLYRKLFGANEAAMEHFLFRSDTSAQALSRGSDLRHRRHRGGLAPAQSPSCAVPIRGSASGWIMVVTGTDPR